MLILSRREGQRLQIGDDVVVEFVRMNGKRADIGVEAPASVRVLRSELLAPGDSVEGLREREDEIPGWVRDMADAMVEDEKHNDHCTADPIFEVQVLRRTYGFDPDYCADVAWLSAEDFGEPDEQDLLELELKYDETGDEPDGWSRVGYTDAYVTVATPFLTREAAEKYIEANRHRLEGDGDRDPKVYVNSAYRNRQMIELRRWLMTFARD